MKHLFKRLDMSLLLTVIILSLISVFMIFSASVLSNESYSEAFWNIFKHFSSLLVGLGFFFIFFHFNYKSFARYWFVFYFFIILILTYVLFYGLVSQGAQRWINLGFLSFQPSEFAKLILMISLSYIISKKEKITSFWQLLPAIVIVGIPFLLITSQPDLGTSLVFIFIFFVIVTMANTDKKILFFMASPILSLAIYNLFPQYNHIFWFIYLFFILVLMFKNKMSFFDIIIFMSLNIGIVFAASKFLEVLKPYQKDRLFVFFDPAIDPLAQGVRYHIDKSITAVGSGGLFGQGFLKGGLSHLQYIPVQDSDFIFSVIAEELGFLGASIVIFLHAFLIYRAVKIAELANDYCGSLLAMAIAGYFLFQCFVNIGMTIGIMPVVGIPLPFVSYGGSALVTNLAAIGLLQNIASRREKLFF